MYRFFLITSLFFATTAFAIPQPLASTDPEVVSSVDFNRYAGLWYEIAHKKNFFQRNCVYSTADYRVISPTEVSVHNICYKDDGDTSDIEGVATVEDPAAPATYSASYCLRAVPKINRANYSIRWGSEKIYLRKYQNG